MTALTDKIYSTQQATVGSLLKLRGIEHQGFGCAHKTYGSNAWQSTESWLAAV